MILVTAVRTGVNAARGALRVARSASSHAAWWLDHNLGGSPRRTAEEPSAGGRREPTTR